MITKVRRNLGDVQTGTNPTRYSTDAITDWINEGYGFYTLQLVSSGEGDFTKQVDIDLVSGQSAYRLPDGVAAGGATDYVKTHLLQRVLDDGRYIPLIPYDRLTTAIWERAVSSQIYLPTYRFRNNYLILEPAPQFNETSGLSHEYYYTPTDMTNNTDEPDENFSKIWHPMLVLYATVAAIETKEATGMTGDPKMFRNRLQKMELSFASILENRSDRQEDVIPFGLYSDC